MSTVQQILSIVHCSLDTLKCPLFNLDPHMSAFHCYSSRKKFSNINFRRQFCQLLVKIESSFFCRITNIIAVLLQKIELSMFTKSWQNLRWKLLLQKFIKTAAAAAAAKNVTELCFFQLEIHPSMSQPNISLSYRSIFFFIKP